MPKTLAEKVWERHVVHRAAGEPDGGARRDRERGRRCGERRGGLGHAHRELRFAFVRDREELLGGSPRKDDPEVQARRIDVDIREWK